MPTVTRTLTDLEVNTILCALRGMYADAYGANGIRRCSPLACDHFEDAPPLTTDEAMELCEQIQLDGVAVTYDAEDIRAALECDCRDCRNRAASGDVLCAACITAGCSASGNEACGNSVGGGAAS